MNRAEKQRMIALWEGKRRELVRQLNKALDIDDRDTANELMPQLDKVVDHLARLRQCEARL
jgi:hypothetical protein